MLSEYASIALFLIVAVLFTVSTLILPGVLKRFGIIPDRGNPVKLSTYECGNETIGDTWVQFNFRYYFYALIFVALDILAVLLYPWAVDLRNLGSFGFVVVIVFVIIVLVGYVYAWRKRVLEWK